MTDAKAVDRRRLTLALDKKNVEKIEKTQDEIRALRNSVELGNKEMAQHFKDDLAFQARTDQAIQSLGALIPVIQEIVPVIQDKLIPAYKREEREQLLWQLLKEKAKNTSFWVGVIMSIGGFFYGVVWVIGKFLPKP